MYKTLENRVVIVTGSGSGIGRASAKVMAAAGAKVVVADIEEAGGNATAEAIRAAGGAATYIKVNVGSEEEVEALISKTISTYGRLDGAFNNAGLEQTHKALHELTKQEWQRIIDVNLTGVFFCMKHEIRAMLASGSGSIVNTASSLARVAIPNCADYVAAKHGVIGLTKAAAADYGPHGIRVNAVLPGVIKTEMIQRAITDPAFSAVFSKIQARHPIGRLGEPSEIGEAAAWLLSDAASFVTGASIPVDGGYLAI